MNNILLSSPDRPVTRLTVWVALFGSFTYLVLSAWAQIVFGDRYMWMNDVRLVSIAAGTLLYALVLRAAMRSRTKAGGPAMLAFYVGGASLVMLAVRYLANRTLSDTPLAFGEHIMWVLVWGGYFGLWVSAFLEMEWRQASAGRAASWPRAAASTRPADIAAATCQTDVAVQPEPLDLADAETWSWVVDALADELGRQSPDARDAVIDRLRQRAGYELADDLGGAASAHNMRARLVNRLADRSRGRAAPRTTP